MSASEPLAGDAPAETVDHVIQVVIDGLRADAITSLGPAQLPNLYRMISEGSWTGNARTDYDFTNTLPNHTGMLTSRPVYGDAGHGVDFNALYLGLSTVHSAAGEYVTSVFDVVHDHGLRTGLYASKSKFELFDNSWNGETGRPDTIGTDNGRDKIDVYQYNSDTSQLTNQFIADMGANPFNFGMISFRDPDSVGHFNGWQSAAYFDAVKAADGYLGRIFGMIDADPQLAGKTGLVLTSDHGGSLLGHGNETLPEHYTIPLLVWGPPVVAGGELYAMNAGVRQNPGAGRPNNQADPQPVRNSDSGNLATQLLGLPPIEGSLFNNGHEFVYKALPPQSDEIGVYRNRKFILDVNDNGTWDGEAHGDMVHVFGAQGDAPLVGDFNGDGVDEIAVHRDRWFYIDLNGNGRWDGTADGDKAFHFDRPGEPIAGDFNGDGIDEVGTHRGRWFLLDLNGNGRWDRIAGGDNAIRFDQTGQAIAGDFDGDGTDEVGTHRGRWFFINSNGNRRWDKIAGGDRAFRFQPWGEALVADFNGDGIDEVGTHRDRWFFLDNNGNGRWDNIAGGDDRFHFVQPGTALAGRWAQPANLAAAPASSRVSSGSTFATAAPPLTLAALQPIVSYASGTWTSAPLTTIQRHAIRDVEIYLTDLPGETLGRALGSTIWIDVTAAGRGWFVDSTPQTNEEFVGGSPAGVMAASAGPAAGRIDLLTVVLHELGHALGWDDVDPLARPHDLMAESLPAGARRLAFPAAVDAAMVDQG